MQHAFRVGQQYRDTGSYRDSNDQFLRWIRGPLDSGIKNTGGIRDLGAARSDTPAALVLVSNDSGISQHDDPWEDTLAVNAGYISYWGDAKATNPYDESAKNQKIKTAFDRTASRQREDVPSVLVLNSLHHRAFDAALFTIDSHYRIRTSPSFDPAHPFLRETILERAGEQFTFPSNVQVRPTFLEELNTGSRGYSFATENSTLLTIHRS